MIRYFRVCVIVAKVAYRANAVDKRIDNIGTTCILCHAMGHNLVFSDQRISADVKQLSEESMDILMSGRTKNQGLWGVLLTIITLTYRAIGNSWQSFVIVYGWTFGNLWSQSLYPAISIEYCSRMLMMVVVVCLI